MYATDRTTEQRREHERRLRLAGRVLAKMREARPWESISPGGIIDYDAPIACTARARRPRIET